jgi:hypothetical protein
MPGVRALGAIRIASNTQSIAGGVTMVPIYALWLPILLAAVIVFAVSSAIHMASPWHKNDYSKIPDERRFMDALRSLATPPGDYMVPRPASTQEMRTPEFLERMKQGPVMIITVCPNGMMSMGRSLGGWFLYCCAVGLFAAYVAGSALPPSAQYPQVFRLVATTAFVGYALALWPMSIWYRRAWSTTIKSTVDGLIYALLTAGTLGWLWPR